MRLPTIVLWLLVFAHIATAASPVELSEKTFKPDKAILMLAVNWGRTWKCGGYENAQLEALTFRLTPLDNGRMTSIELKTPSRLFVENRFVAYAFVVEPGEYILTGFDVKVARSVSDVAHIRGTEADLVSNGKPTGGSFLVKPNEATYVGHFGLDRGAEPFLWRYYLEDRKDFERWVAGFRARYPFVKALPARFRLFDTPSLGKHFDLADAVVP